VVWEENTIIVSAQILGQHTEDEGVAALACLQKHRLVTFSGAQFMVDIRNGLIGLSVAGHVMEELKIMTVHAPTPRLLTEEKTAAEWDELTSHGHVTHIGAQCLQQHL